MEIGIGIKTMSFIQTFENSVSQLTANKKSETDFIKSLSDYKSVYVYGAGNVGKKIHSFLYTIDINTKAFLDINASDDSNYEGVNIINPVENKSEIKGENSVVVIGVFNRDCKVLDIVNLLQSLKFERVVTFSELYEYTNEYFGDKFWLSPKDIFKEEITNIETAYDLFSDDISKVLFESILNYRISDCLAKEPPVEDEMQYFSKTIPNLKKPAFFVDCGAFDGDTLPDLYNFFGTVDNLIAFEPDSDNFNKLSMRIKKSSNLFAKQLIKLPAGVWRENTVLKMSEGNGEASKVDGDENGVSVQCLSLDETIGSGDPDFIKMDIEGAEYDAIVGSKNIIERCQPILAISVYHRPTDLWAIQLLIDSYNCSYNYYLRTYKNSTFDTILYCIPK